MSTRVNKNMYVQIQCIARDQTVAVRKLFNTSPRTLLGALKDSAARATFLTMCFRHLNVPAAATMIEESSPTRGGGRRRPCTGHAARAVSRLAAISSESYAIAPRRRHGRQRHPLIMSQACTLPPDGWSRRSLLRAQLHAPSNEPPLSFGKPC